MTFKAALDAMSEIDAKRDAQVVEIQAAHVAALRAARALSREAKREAKREATRHCLASIELAHRAAFDARVSVANGFRS